ncbi:choice-of-anchor P family protein [Nocardioides panzhihuensis]|uniref:DUF3494 domain-containing protein n=1 Tax=Nocardioides panzhihuensis TaxID=860243 RepID=A0A7Z0IU96_9ACTN|nr:choice-of-anchor P family protein [Nocardioides panzhihuensis]NYI79745.1 hypothetical protein [Nocardioides panzhihuensis]
MRTLALSAASVAVVGAVLAVPAPSQAALTNTDFGLFASGFGTRVTGGSLPANSGDLGYQTIGCTRKAGHDVSNNTAGAKVPGLGTIGATTTRQRTIKSGSMVKSISEHKIADVVLDKSPLGKVTVEGLSSVSQAWWDGKGYKSDSKAKIAHIVLDPAGPGRTIDLPIPGRDKPLVIPGIATIGIGNIVERANADGAHSYANGVWIKLHGTDSEVTIGRSRAEINGQAFSAVFNGFSNSVDASALGGAVQVGKNPLTNAGCAGTKGKLKTKSIGHVPLGEVGNIVDVKGLTSGQRSNQTKTTAEGYTFGEVANVNIGDGAIRIEAIRAQANAKYVKGKGSTSSISGTKFGDIYIGKQKVSLAQLESALSRVDIPGLAKIETKVVVERSKNLVEVVALRLTLLDGTKGTKTVVNIGHAKFKVNANK